MDIFLVRHTSVALGSKVCYGQTDVELADSFPDEVKGIRKRQLLPTDFDVCYSSPLQRCAKLATTLYTDTVTYDDRLLELNFGDWELKYWTDLYSPQFEEWCNNFDSKPCPNGEPFNALYNRVCDFWQELKTKNHKNVLIVTHNGWLLASFAHLLGMPLKNCFNLDISYGGISKIAMSTDPYFFKVHYINR